MVLKSLKNYLLSSAFLLSCVIGCKGAEFASNAAQNKKSTESEENALPMYPQNVGEDFYNFPGNEFDDDGNIVGTTGVVIDSDGNVIDLEAEGFKIDVDGNITDRDGNIVGIVRSITDDGNDSATGSGSIREGQGVSGSAGELIVQTFQSNESKSTTKSDVFWILDTSESMQNEIDHVSKNLNTLINTIDKMSDVKVGMLYKDLERSIFGINTKIEFKMDRDLRSKIDEIDSTLVYSKEAFKRFKDFIGRNDSFFREDSVKTVIIVTDDDDKMDNDDFLKAAWNKFGKDKFKLYGFIGLNKDCKIANKGDEYKKAIDKTGGKYWNICDKNWEKNFDALADAVISTVGTDFELDHEIAKIEKIELDGRRISNADYRFSGRDLKLSKDVLGRGGQNIEIHYYRK